MDTTTADDIFNSVVGALDRVGVDWTCAVSWVTSCKWLSGVLIPSDPEV